MKSLARSDLWWPNLHQDIEDKMKKCPNGQAVRKAPPVGPLHPGKWATRVWQRVHIDYAEVNEQQFLIVIDSHSQSLQMAKCVAQATVGGGTRTEESHPSTPPGEFHAPVAYYSPAKLFLKHHLRTRFSLRKPDLELKQWQTSKSSKWSITTKAGWNGGKSSPNMYVHMDHLMKGELPKPGNREPAQPVWTPSVIPQGLSTCSPSPTPEEVPVLCLMCKEAQPGHPQQIHLQLQMWFQQALHSAVTRREPGNHPRG